MRINALTRSYEQEFAKYGISFKVFGGFKFFERKEIKDLLAYLRVINNPFDDEAVVRIINFPRRGIGGKTVETLQAYADDTQLSVYDAIVDADELNLNSSAKAKLKDFASVIKDLIVQSQALEVDKLVDYLIKTTKMREVYSDNSDESLTKRANHRRISEFDRRVCPPQPERYVAGLSESGYFKFGYRRYGRRKLRHARYHSFGKGTRIQRRIHMRT